MNKFIGIGRLTKDPEVRYAQNEKATAVARFTIAIDRKFKNGNEQAADFIPVVTFGKTAEFVEKYFHKGMKIVVEGEVRTGSYTNKDGQKVYTTDINASSVEFAESKQGNTQDSTANDNTDGFMNIPDGIEEELPFN